MTEAGNTEIEAPEYDPDAAYDAYMAQREYEIGGGREDEVAAQALDAQPDAAVVEFSDRGERFLAIRLGQGEFEVRHETEYDPREFELQRGL